MPQIKTHNYIVYQLIVLSLSVHYQKGSFISTLQEYLYEALPDTTNELLENMSSVRNKLKGNFQEKISVLHQLTTAWLKQEKEKEKEK